MSAPLSEAKETMITALLGKKIGMTRVFDGAGMAVPVTVLQVGPCRVMQVKTKETDGYLAAQIGFGEKKRTRATKPEGGHAKKAGVEPAKLVREVRCDDVADLETGQELTVAMFNDVAAVNVTGTSKGKGFTGVMKRYGFRGNTASHGASKDHRRPGSIGQSADPSRVLKGTRMPGHAGAGRSTVRKLEVVRIDEENNLLLVKGAVPGPNGGYVTVKAVGK